MQGCRHVLHCLPLGRIPWGVFKGQGVGKGAFKADFYSIAFHSHVQAGRAVFVRAMRKRGGDSKQNRAGCQKNQVFHHFSHFPGTAYFLFLRQKMK